VVTRNDGVMLNKTMTGNEAVTVSDVLIVMAVASCAKATTLTPALTTSAT
jgi:hypothetical protein